MDRAREIDVSILLKNLANAKNDDEIFNVLMEMSLVLESRKDICRVQLSELDLSQFLKQLNALTGKAKTAGISLLGKVFVILNPVEIVSKYIENFTEGLVSDVEEIKILYLKQLEIASGNAQGVSFLHQNLHNAQSPVLEHVAENIADNSIGVAKIAANVIQNVCILSESVNEVLSEGYVSVLIRHLSKGSVVCFRVYELFVKIFLSRNEILQNSHVVRVFESLINEMNTDDILSQLNCLDMLSEMACRSSDGLQFIENHGTLEKVDRIFKSAESNPLQELLVPGAVKFFGSIAIVKPLEILTNYGTFLKFVFENIESQDSSLVALCFETIANICTSAAGLELLCNDQEKLNKSMNAIGKYIQSSIDESIKLRLLEAMSMLFRSEGPVDATSSVKETLYRNISDSPLHLLMETSKKPFPAIRCSSLAVLSNLATYSWVEEDMALTAGFLEYLLDRKTEPNKEGKVLKYGIIKTLSESQTSKANLGVVYYQRICQYAKEGPFRSDQQTAVMFEEA